MKGHWPDECLMCECYEDDWSVCCGCLKCGCACGFATTEVLNGRVQCRGCNCKCGQYYDPRSNLFECAPCYCQDKGECDCDTGCCECGNGCFPSTARLTLENGKFKTMSELNMGDKVQTGTDIEKFSLYYLINLYRHAILNFQFVECTSFKSNLYMYGNS